jgi:hypothetical protein
MRMIAKLILLTVLLCGNAGFFPSPVNSRPAFLLRLTNILITDIHGRQKKLSDPQFLYTDTVPHLRDHFEVIIGTTYRRSIWVHFARIRKVFFHKKEGVTEILIGSDSRKLLYGGFPDNGLLVSGKEKLKEVAYPISKVKSIQFNEFELRPPEGRTVLDRSAAALLLEREWENARITSSAWTINDRGISFDKVKQVNIVNCYRTNRIGELIYTDRTFRRCDEPESHRYLSLKRGKSPVEIFIDELEFLEITGRQVAGGLQVIAATKDDKKPFPAVYPFDLDEGDMIVWKTAIGYEGISILPLRRIRITACK